MNEEPGPAAGLPAEQRIARLTSLYAALSRTNEAIFREPDRLALCRAVCEIAVTHGRLVTAAVRMVNHATGMLDPYCSHGPSLGWIGQRLIALDDPVSAAARVAREGVHYVSNDIAADPRAPGARDDAASVGVRAAAVFALNIDGARAGVFSVFAAETGYFDAELVGLLEEIARNLSFAFSRQTGAAALALSEAHYRALFDASPDAIRVTCEGKVVLINPAGVRLFGLKSAAEMIGRPTSESVAPEDRAQGARRVRTVLEEQRPVPPVEQMVLRADGSRVLAEVVSLPVEYGGKPAALSILRDLTARKDAERRVGRLTNLYAALSRTNEAIFRETDPRALCERVCEIAVTHGGLLSAAVRRLDPATGMLEAYAQHGPTGGMIGVAPIMLDNPHSNAAQVARAGGHYVSNDIFTDPSAVSSRADALRLGVRAAAGFALHSEGELAGVLSVFAGEAGYFDPELTGLLAEMAGNVSYAFSRQRSEAARRTSEAQYRMLFDASPDAMRVVCDGRVVLVNAAAVALFGAPSAAVMLGKPVFDTIAPEHRALAIERVRMVMEERRPVPMAERLLLREDGSHLLVEVVILPVEFEGRPAALSILRDLTARKASEKRVRRLTQLYDALSHTNEAIFRETDARALCERVCEIAVVHGGLLSAAVRRYNPATRMLEAYTRHGPTGGSVGIAPIALDNPASNAAKVARAGGHYYVNDLSDDAGSAYARADIERLGIRAAAGFTLHADGELAGLFSVYAGETGYFDTELTSLLAEMAGNVSYAFSKQRSAAALVSSEERYRLLFEASPDAIRVICEDRVVMLNPAGVRLFGLASAEGMVGKLVYDTIDPQYLAIARERVRTVIEERRPVPSSEQALIRADGRRIDVEVTTLPFEYEGKPAALSIVHDLTARKAVERATLRLNAELEDRVQRRTAALKRANEDLEAFSYTVAHDLRAPLRRMTGFAALLKESLGDSLGIEERAFMARIAEGGDIMNLLIEGLLEIAQLGRTKLKPAQVDLSALAAACAAELREREPGRAVDFVAAPGLTAHADPRLIKSVLENLLANAWKFTSAHPAARIEFGALAPGSIPPDRAGAGPNGPPPGTPGAWRIYYVRDDGAGFDARYADKLFGTFQRLHAREEFPGTGIGLASVKRIISSHGGQVWAEGVVEQGATFYFTLPVAG